MGKGDRRTKRGKIFRHSFGKFRMKKKDTVEGQASPQAAPKAEAPAKDKAAE